jgi:hypothetical protein
MLLLGNEKATRRPLPAANSRKRLLPRCSLFAAFADQTAKSRNSRKRPQRIQAFLSPETGVRIPVAVLAANGSRKPETPVLPGFFSFYGATRLRVGVSHAEAVTAVSARQQR